LRKPHQQENGYDVERKSPARTQSLGVQEDTGRESVGFEAFYCGLRIRVTLVHEVKQRESITQTQSFERQLALADKKVTKGAEIVIKPIARLRGVKYHNLTL
jgi:hypothetical protein